MIAERRPKTDQALLKTLLKLHQSVEEGAGTYLENWHQSVGSSRRSAGGQNLARYLALRRHDLRDLQVELAKRGLSSLGRCESRVQESLEAIISMLGSALGSPVPVSPPDKYYAGEQHLKHNANVLFGGEPIHRRVRIMVTLPTEAATDPTMLRTLLVQGMNVARINCAHDSASVWRKMIKNLRKAEELTGHECRVLMDLGGPKIRTGEVITPKGESRVFEGDTILLTARPPTPDPDYPFQAHCTHPEVLEQLEVGAEVRIDDGKISGKVIEKMPQGVLLRVYRVSPKGKKLRPEKGLNFPTSNLRIKPLGDKDLQDLKFVAKHADLVGYSFVQEPEDMRQLLEVLERYEAPPSLGILAKIETQLAVQNLPELIMSVIEKRPLGVMIARGDLAVEIGYLRLSEMQEEILWICEAAFIPVVWATQVLEQLVKEGIPSRAELSDAAMSERSECVMLNKGAFVAEAVAMLDELLSRMRSHQHKKTPRLRALHSWQ